MHSLIEYSINYSDTSGSLWQFKRDKKTWTMEILLMLLHHLHNAADSSSFKYKSSFVKPIIVADNGVFKDVKIAAPLNYLSNFWRSLEMALINCKIHLKLNWTKDCVMSTIADVKF